MNAPVPLHSPPCPLCRSTAYRTVMTGARDMVWRKPGTFRLQRCEDCGLVATRPRPTPEALSFYYEDTYSGEGAEAQDNPMRTFQTESGLGRLISRYRLKVIHKTGALGADDRLLDVGCSYGGFLRVAREVTGCATAGIDMDAGSIADAVDQDVTEYHTGRLVDAGLDAERFTAITFFESLEHHSEPVAALREAHRLLAPGGIAVIEVPNWDGLWRRVFRTAWLPLLIPQHLFHFTPKTLAAMLEEAGFERVEHQQTMFYPLEGVASLGIWLARVTKSPPPGSPFTWRTPIDIALFLMLVLLYLVFEWPSQALLQLTGRTGHQMAIARKGLEGIDSERRETEIGVPAAARPQPTTKAHPRCVDEVGEDESVAGDSRSGSQALRTPSSTRGSSTCCAERAPRSAALLAARRDSATTSGSRLADRGARPARDGVLSPGAARAGPAQPPQS